MHTETLKTGRRYNGKCACGAKFSTLILTIESGEIVGPVPLFGDRSTQYRAERTDFAAYTNDHYRLIYTCQGCGAAKIAKPVLGKFVAGKTCNALCLASAGHSCECSCGGKNHGASHG